ncbi:asparaginase [Schaalia hyovaginalis]|uniref:L-asparaginase n=1 Tax=Schaalia hyovaginalis TaxID=29316 RepID=A0A923IXK3_9ACTO|nr:asparaginase [Schaalia hyovaginalis]MBB6334508.1 L-asparaginase [Schaalia hyovaginalis]
MRRIVAIGTTGGTISMSSAHPDGPATPTINGEDLAAPLALWADDLEIRSRTLLRVGSPQLRLAHVLEVLSFAESSVDEGACGVVIVQGTDTLEEVAYLLDLLWSRDEPLVVTGAMRASDDAGAEGMGNLLAAVRVASDERMRAIGVLAVLNDEAHLASLVTKVDANALAAFRSASWGPVAKFVEGRVVSAYRPLDRMAPLPLPDKSEPRIPIIMAALDDDGELLRAAISTRPRGIVVSAMGSGHVPVPMADAAEEAVRAGIPVVFASRTGGGTTTRNSYGYPGSEVDLLRRGLIGAGWLDARKSRLLLHLLVAKGASSEKIAAEFTARGRL